MISSILVFFLIFTVSFTGCIDRGYRKLGIDIWVLKTDARGAIEWKTVIDNDPNNRGREIIQTRNGGYAYSGFVVPEFTEFQPQGYPGSSLQLVRTDKGGNVTLNMQYDIGNYGPVSSIIQTDDWGFAIMGNSYENIEKPSVFRE